MKFFYQLILATVLCSSASYLQAQISKGTSLLGGSIQFNSNNSESTNNGYKDKNSLFRVSPTYGVFIKQNLAIGGELSYANINSTTSTSGNWGSQYEKRKENRYGASVFLRHYKNLGRSGFYLFLHDRLGAEISRIKTKNVWDAPYRNSKGYNIGLSVSPGIAYAVTPKFHIETGLNNLLYVNYSNTKNEAEQSSAIVSKSSNFNAGASIGESLEFTVGFRILFAK